MPVLRTAMPLAILYYDAKSVIAQRRVHGLGPNHDSRLMYTDQLCIEKDDRGMDDSLSRGVSRSC